MTNQIIGRKIIGAGLALDVRIIEDEYGRGMTQYRWVGSTMTSTPWADCWSEYLENPETGEVELAFTIDGYDDEPFFASEFIRKGAF